MDYQDQNKRSRRPVENGSAAGTTVQGAPFPHIEISEEASSGRNADSVPRVPEGPRRGPTSPPAPNTRSEKQRSEDSLRT